MEKLYHILQRKKRYSIVIFYKNGTEKHSPSRSPSKGVAERWQRQSMLNDLVSRVDIVETLN